MSRRRTIHLLGVLLALALLLMPASALADIVQNDVTGQVRITTADSATVAYWIEEQKANQDGQAGCNASDGTPAIISIHTPPNVFADRTSLTFSACGDANSQSVVFTASVPDTYSVTVTSSDSGNGSYDDSKGSFTLRVRQPDVTDPTPPVITPSVSGTLGNSGWYVTDVTVSWIVTENESTDHVPVGLRILFDCL